jgi:hypothetical protein
VIAREAGKSGIDERGKGFTRSVGAEIEAKHAVSVLDAFEIAHNRRQYELIAEIMRVRIGNDSIGTWKAWPLRVCDGTVGLGDTVPALVAIHRVIATTHRCDRNGRRQRRAQTLDVILSGARRRVSSIGKNMHDGGYASLREQRRQRSCVVLMGMHAARRSQAKEVAGAAGLTQASDEVDQGGGRFDPAVGHRVVYALQILHDNAPGADVEMSHLGVSHLTRRQADVLARRLQQCVGAGAPQSVEVGRVRLTDSIVDRVFTPTPAVQNDQHHRPMSLHAPDLSRLTFNPAVPPPQNEQCVTWCPLRRRATSRCDRFPTAAELDANIRH